MQQDGDKTSGVKTIYPFDKTTKISTFCDQMTDDGGWTVILNREPSDVREDFDRTFSDYEKGFGNTSSEFWLGLKTIHQLTTLGCTELRIEMEDFDSKKYIATYSTFTVGSQVEGYVLNIEGFSSSPSFEDSFSEFSKGMKFTANDKDNDQDVDNCAVKYGGGWWYKSCALAKLTGFPFGAGTQEYAKGIYWKSITDFNTFFKKATMKIRQLNSC